MILNATTDWIPYWGEAVIIVTGAYLAGDYLDNRYPLFREVSTEISGAGLSSVNLPGSVALAEHEMNAVHDAGQAIVSADGTVGRWGSDAAGGVARSAERAGGAVEHAADETGHAIREGWHTVTSSITSSIGRWF